jgi:hypothetical protein
LLSHHETPLHAVPADTRCVGSAPAVCVAPGYLADAPSARAALLPALERLQSAGAPVPARFVQGALPGARSVGPLEATFLLGDHSDAAFLVVNAYLSKNCFSTGSSRLEDEWSALVGWLDPRAAKGGSDAGLPAVALGPSTPAQRLWVRRVVEDLSACGR